EQLAAYRAAVDHDRRGPELARIVRRLDRAGYAIDGDRLKSRPRGVAADHPRIELMRHRSIYAGRTEVSPPWIDTPRTLDEVRAAWREFTPLVRWLEAASRH